MIARSRDTGFSVGGRRRLAAAAGAVALHAALIGALLTVRPSIIARPVEHALVMLDISPPEPPAEPPPPAKPQQKPKPKTEGAAAPPAPKAHPKPVVAPPVPMVPPPPIPAAPVAAKGPDATAGASDRPGPGTGAGGAGNGLGSGGAGSGSGGGGGVRARRIRGGINIADYPRAAAAVRAGGTVIIHLDIDTVGRVSACRVARSSGNTDLDRTTCRLATERFRYRPATDRAGRPAPDIVGWRQDWWTEPRD